MDRQTRLFEEHRAALKGFAYRMLGSVADADDVVQDTYLRWRQVREAAIANPRAWLFTACGRLALNTLRSARVRREAYVGMWLPEPLFDHAPSCASDPLEVDDTVSMALMHALETLSAAERAGYLLHEVFDFSFDEIAAILGRSNASCRQLASRARQRIRDARPRFKPSAAEHQSLLAAFLAASRNGDVGAFAALMTADVEFCSDGGGKVVAAPGILRGAEEIFGFFAGVWQRLAERGSTVDSHPVWINGAPGLLIVEDGAVVTVMSLDVQKGRIRRIFAVRNPDKLKAATSVPGAEMDAVVARARRDVDRVRGGGAAKRAAAGAGSQQYRRPLVCRGRSGAA